ncbi:hypothetical protein [Tranquillimonas alkanivorans]|nr:hypothetical protein [Tranquillimonas alkanivorans]
MTRTDGKMVGWQFLDSVVSKTTLYSGEAVVTLETDRTDGELQVLSLSIGGMGNWSGALWVTIHPQVEGSIKGAYRDYRPGGSASEQMLSDAQLFVRTLAEIDSVIPWGELPDTTAIDVGTGLKAQMVSEVPYFFELDDRLQGLTAFAFANLASRALHCRKDEERKRIRDAANRKRKKLFDALPAGAVLFSTTRIAREDAAIIGVISAERGSRTKRTMHYPEDLNPRSCLAGGSDDLDIYARDAFQLLTEASAAELKHLSAHKRLHLSQVNKGLEDRFLELA